MNNLHSIHEHMTLKKQEFYNNDTTVKPQYLEEIKQIRKIINVEKDETNRYNMQQQIKEIKKIINKMDNNQKKYYLENFEILEKYYRNKKNIDNNVNDKININKKLFKSDQIDNNKNIFNVNHYIKYWFNNDIIIEKNDDIQICINCKKEIDNAICKRCSVINKTLEMTTVYEVNETVKTNYVRVNHMKKILKQIQGIRTMNIPLHIIDRIRDRINKERINYHELTNEKIKTVLKQLKLLKYIDQSIFFLILFTKRIIVFTQEIMTKILDVFIRLEKPFARYIMNTNRKNFFNYTFLLNQILIHLGEKPLDILPIVKNYDHMNKEIILFNKLIEEIYN